MKPVVCSVGFHGSPRTVSCGIVNEWDLQLCHSWEEIANSLSETDNQKLSDAVAYAYLAEEKWKRYRASNHCFVSLTGLVAAIANDPQCEVCGAIYECSNWYPYGSVLGFALVRRTWCNHITIDYLAGHPRAVSCQKDVRGIAFPLLYSVALLAESISAPIIWLETTDQSVQFYRAKLSQNASDLLIIETSKVKAITSPAHVGGE